MKFSVLLPTRNRLDLLAMAIQTVVLQDYENWEIIVSDNFSDEDIQSHIESIGDPRIKYSRTEAFVPVTENWNNALKQSSGDYVIMLGDDDGLLQGYFTALKEQIEIFERPDVIYTNAFMFAYPKVLPSDPDGFLRSYTNRSLFKDKNSPYLLDKRNALELVEQSLDFKYEFDYNMQFSLVSRKLIEKMSNLGEFYQSPYPDYYATNAIMLCADKVLVVPRHCVAIGISPKSFGYYYFNDKEVDGNKFLKNIPEKNMLDKLRDVILPGSEMNTSWLIAMETILNNLKKVNSEPRLSISYDRYRSIQIYSIYSDYISGYSKFHKAFMSLIPHLKWKEKIRYGIIFSALIKLLPDCTRRSISEKLRSLIQSHPQLIMPQVKGSFQNILEVHHQITPEQINYLNGY